MATKYRKPQVMWRPLDISTRFLTFYKKIYKKTGFFCGNFTQKYQKTGFCREICSKISKKGFFSAKILIFFWQNPVSGPHKRHDGGWNCLIIQKKLTNLVKFCRKFGQKTRLFSENLLKNTKKGQNLGIFFAKSTFRST